MVESGWGYFCVSHIHSSHRTRFFLLIILIILPVKPCCHRSKWEKSLQTTSSSPNEPNTLRQTNCQERNWQQIRKTTKPNLWKQVKQQAESLPAPAAPLSISAENDQAEKISETLNLWMMFVLAVRKLLVSYSSSWTQQLVVWQTPDTLAHITPILKSLHYF